MEVVREMTIVNYPPLVIYASITQIVDLVLIRLLVLPDKFAILGSVFFRSVVLQMMIVWNLLPLSAMMVNVSPCFYDAHCAHIPYLPNCKNSQCVSHQSRRSLRDQPQKICQSTQVVIRK